MIAVAIFLVPVCAVAMSSLLGTIELSPDLNAVAGGTFAVLLAAVMGAMAITRD